MELDLALNKAHSRRWPASLQMGFDQGETQTRLKHMAFKGPLRVQRPFYPEGERCHAYLLHPPGGLVSGDDLRIEVTCQPGSKVLLTTPSAGKIYRSDSFGVVQKQHVEISVEDAQCEWLPMETIVFDGANGELSTTVQLHGDSQFIGIDLFCLGRPKSGLPFVSGSVEQRLSVYRDSTPLMLERQWLSSDDPLLSARSGFDGNLVSGTLVCVGLADLGLSVESLRQALPEPVHKGLTITHRREVLVVRYLGQCSFEAMTWLRLCWKQLRPKLLHVPAVEPRIWAT